MIIECQKIGSGTDADPIRPDTDATGWSMISETETTMTIKIKDVQLSE